MRAGESERPAAVRLPAAEEKAKGSITIYLALSLIIVMVLIFTLIESARVSAVNYRLRSITYMGADSVFSEFAQPVFSDYGIMALWKSEDEFINEFTQYVGYNLDKSDTGYYANAELYGMAFSGCSLADVTYITDDSGLVFASQVYEYMEYYIAADTASQLLEGLDIFSQSSAAGEFMDKLEEYTEVFTDVEEKVLDVSESVEDVQSMNTDPCALLEELGYDVELYSTEEVSSSVFSQTLTDLKNAKSALESALEDIEDATDDYYESVKAAKAAAAEIESLLSSEGSELDEDIYESLLNLLKELESMSTDTDADYYGVISNEEAVQECKSVLEKLEEMFEQLDDGLNEDNAQEYLEIIEKYQDILEDFDLDSLGIDLETDTSSSQNSSILSFVSSLIDKGVLAYVMDDISEKTVDTDEFPSETVKISDDDSDGSLAQATLNRVIFGQYVLDCFGNASETREDTALDYEVEYVIGGENSDLENLKIVVASLVALRSGLNFISILQDSSKLDEANTLAAAMVGATGMPLLIKAFQILILAAWSAAEAVVDVKALLEGKKVATIKGSDDWNLSIEGFKNFTGKDIETKACESGLGYEEYLRVLLAVKSTQTLSYRTMDLIQANMCLNENGDFRMAECITGVSICAEYTAAQLFTAFGFVSSSLSASDGSYSFSLVQLYEY